VHPGIIAAVLTEMEDLECWPMLAGIQAVEPCTFNRCIRQGGTESPWLWNTAARAAIAPLLDEWEASGCGIDIPGFGRMTHMIWADNIYLLSSDMAEVAWMAQTLTDQFSNMKLRWKAGSLAHMGTGASVGSAAFNVIGSDGPHQVLSTTCVDVLGCELSASGSSAPMVAARLCKGTAAFWKHKDVLLDRSITLRTRYGEFQKRVLSCALFCSGTWVWDRTLADTICTWENGLLRRMLGSKRRSGENFVDHIRRSTRRALELLVNWGFETAATKVLRNIHRHASSIKGLGCDVALHSLQLLPQVMRYRNAMWWRACQALAGETASSIGEWRHHRCGRIATQWETVLVQVIGQEWVLEASAGTWQQHFQRFRNGAMAWVQRKVPEVKYLHQPRPTAPPDGRARKRARVLPPLQIHWQGLTATQVWVGGDNDLVIGWLNGTKRAKFDMYRGVARSLLRLAYSLVMSERLSPADRYSDIWNHVFREDNAAADALANKGHGQPLSLTIYGGTYHFLRAQFDGSKSAAGTYAVGYIIYGTTELPDKHVDRNSWQVVCEGCGAVNAKSVVQSELMACCIVSTLVFATARRLDLATVWRPLAACATEFGTLSKWLQRQLSHR